MKLHLPKGLFVAVVAAMAAVATPASAIVIQRDLNYDSVSTSASFENVNGMTYNAETGLLTGAANGNFYFQLDTSALKAENAKQHIVYVTNDTIADKQTTEASWGFNTAGNGLDVTGYWYTSGNNGTWTNKGSVSNGLFTAMDDENNLVTLKASITKNGTNLYSSGETTLYNGSGSGGLYTSTGNIVSMTVNSDFVKNILYNVSVKEDGNTIIANADGSWSKTYETAKIAYNAIPTSEMQATIINSSTLQLSGNSTDASYAGKLNTNGGDIIIGGSGQLYIQTWYEGAPTSGKDINLSGRDIYIGTTSKNDGALKLAAWAGNITLGTITLVENSSIWKEVNAANDNNNITTIGAINGEKYTLDIRQLTKTTLNGDINLGGIKISGTTALTLANKTYKVGYLELVKSSLSLQGSGLFVVDGTISNSDINYQGFSPISIGKNVTLKAKQLNNNWGTNLTVDGRLELGEGGLQLSSGSTDAISGAGTITTNVLGIGNAGTYIFGGGLRVEIGAGGIQQTSINTSTSETLVLRNVTIAATESWSQAVGKNIKLGDSTTGTTFEIAQGKASTISGILSDESETSKGKLVKTGAGTLTLSGTNTYSGGTTISGGELVVNNGSALGTGMVTVQNGATLNVNGKAAAMAAIEGVTLESGSTLKNSSTEIYAATNQLSTLILNGDATIDASYRFGLVSTTGTGNSMTWNDTSLQLNGNTLTIKGSHSSKAYGVIFAQTQVTGEGNTGTIQVTEGGKILFGHDGRGDTSNLSGATISLAQGTTLDIEDSSAHVKIGGLTGDGTVTNAGKLEINGSGSYVFSGVIKDFTKNNGTVVRKGSLIKSGTGTLTLSGTNTYSGGTIIEGGNLVMGNKSTQFLGTGPVTLAGGNLIWWGNGGTIDTVSVTKNSDFTIHDQDDANANTPGTITLSSVSIAEGTTLTVNKNNTTGTFGPDSNKNYSDSWKHNLNISLLTGAGKLDIDGPAGSAGGKVNAASSIKVDSLKNANGSFSGDIAITSNETTVNNEKKNIYTATINTGADGASFKSLTAAGFGEAGETSAFTFNVQGATTVENINVTSGKAIIDIAKEGTLNAFTKGGDGSITMKGSGIYNLGNTTALNATLDSTWTGTVKMSGATLADANLNNYGNAGSTVQISGMTGSMAAQTVNTKVVFDGKDSAAFDWKGTGAASLTFANTVSGKGNIAFGSGTGHNITFSGDVKGWEGVLWGSSEATSITYSGNATEINHELRTGSYKIQNDYVAGTTDVTYQNKTGMVVNGAINTNEFAKGTVNLKVQNEAGATGEVVFNGAISNNSNSGATNLTVGEGASAKFTNANVKLTDVTMDKGASLAITAAKTLTFQNLTLADGTTINPKEAATLVDAAEATTNVSITVSGKASFGADATINADLTLANGATVEMADALTLGGTLTLNTGLTLGGELLTTIVGFAGQTDTQKQILFTVAGLNLVGADALTTAAEVGISETTKVAFSDYFTNDVTTETGDYYLGYDGSNVYVEFVAKADEPEEDPSTPEGGGNVPEPTTGALSLLGLVALAMRRRRRA